MLSAAGKASASRFTNIMEPILQPFGLWPPPNCLRLKTKVTFSPPRLATSEWLVLTRRESHRYMIRPKLGRTPAPLI